MPSTLGESRHKGASNTPPCDYLKCAVREAGVDAETFANLDTLCGLRCDGTFNKEECSRYIARSLESFFVVQSKANGSITAPPPWSQTSRVPLSQTSKEPKHGRPVARRTSSTGSSQARRNVRNNCSFGAHETGRPGIISRGTEKRINKVEKAAWHSGVDVEFQRCVWADSD